MSRGGKLAPEVNRALFVKNLSYNVTPEELFDLFGKFGPIRQIRQGIANNTKGTAFVVYEDVMDAKSACDKLNGFNFQNRYLVVLYHQPSKSASMQNLAERQENLEKLKREHGIDQRCAGAAAFGETLDVDTEQHGSVKRKDSGISSTGSDSIGSDTEAAAPKIRDFAKFSGRKLPATKITNTALTLNMEKAPTGTITILKASRADSGLTERDRGHNIWQRVKYTATVKVGALSGMAKA